MLLVPVSRGQVRHYEVEALGATGTDGSLPFWATANRFGTLREGGANALTRLNLGLSQGRLSAGIEGIVRAGEGRAVYLNQLYAEASYGAFVLSAGRKAEGLILHDSTLSMGSLLYGTNTTPIPRIMVSVPGWAPVPFTQRWLLVRGFFLHGWMEPDRYVRGTLLHGKAAYIGIQGTLPVRLYGGLAHAALWGGESPELGHLPAGFDDYLRVVFGDHGGEDAPEGETSNRLGDHLGVWQAGLETLRGPYRLGLYWEHPFEDNSGRRLRSKSDLLAGLSLRRRDGTGLVSGLVLEHLFTKDQSGPIHPPGNDSYYNHWVYWSGWTYYRRVIGSPMLTPAREGLGIENNRVVAFHMGLEGMLLREVPYRFLATYSRNYGTHDRPYPDPRGLRQLSLGLELAHSLSRPRLDLRAGFMLDQGSFYPHRAGLMLSVTHHGQF